MQANKELIQIKFNENGVISTGPRLTSGTITGYVRVVGTGALTATVLIEGNNDLENENSWTTLATLTISGDDDQFDEDFFFTTKLYARVTVSNFSGKSGKFVLSCSEYIAP